MAQGIDGSLWLGTGEGLYRFDGASFKPLGEFRSAFDTSNVTALNIFPDGDVWAGFYLGGVMHIKDGKATHYGLADGFPAGWVLDFAKTPDGAIWAAAEKGLARYQNGQWSTIGADWDFPTQGAGWVLVDKLGNVWATGTSSLYFLAEGSHKFKDTHIALGEGAVLAIDADGVLWVSDKVQGTRALPGVTAAHPSLLKNASKSAAAFITSNRMVFDHEGHMWGTDSQSGGVYLVLNPREIADGRSLHASDISYTFTKGNGLTSDLTDPLLCDREGGVWVGTIFGLDNFRLSSVSTISGLDIVPGVDFNVAVDSVGDPWVLNGKTIYHIQNGALQQAITMPEIAHNLAGARDGSLWFETESALYRYAKGTVSKIALPDGVTDANIAAFTSDQADGVWIAFRNDHLYHWSGSRWSNAENHPSSGTPTALAVDNDALWIGYADGRVMVKSSSGDRLFSVNDGLRIGAVSSFNLETTLKLIAGERGLARFNHGSFQVLSSFGPREIGGVSGIAYHDANFWLNSDRGVFRISAKELQAAFDSPDYIPRYKLFQYRDGLPGFALQSKPLPTALVDRQGRIWLETDLGIAWIDPSRIRTNSVALHAEIVNVSSDGKQFEIPRPADRIDNHPVASIELPKRTTSIDIQYATTEMAMPESVQFRYKLNGVDKKWHEVGTRREAFYANLLPGTYTFDVMAQNEDGIWSASAASVNLHIPPMFYHMRMFLVACVTLLVMVVAMLYRMRLRQATDLVRSRINERHAERERIAREIHDTLLQSIQGLILTLQGIAYRIPAGEKPRNLIESALGTAEQVLVDGRDRILDLRSTAEQSRDLPRAFALIGTELGLEASASLRIIVEGGGRDLDPFVTEEIYWIGREAITNAFKHSQADLIEVEINQGRDQFLVRIRDNGCGLPESIVKHGGKPGHWGLRGMRERATGIGGLVVIWGREGLGTEIELKLPASIAYAGKQRSYTGILQSIVGGRRRI